MSNRTTILETTDATIYLSGGFGYHAVEVRKLRVDVGPYAQYPLAYFVSYIEKGKRKEAGQVLTREPKGLIVAGHGQPKVLGPMSPTGDGTTMSRHSCFSDEWHKEFETFRAERLSGARVLLDITNTSPEAALKANT
jgi:hypothetical protein